MTADGPAGRTAMAGGEPALRRSLGAGSLVSIGVGVVIGQGSMVAMLQAAGMGTGWVFYAALAVALLISMSYVDTFSELALMLPQSAGLGRYTEIALGPFLAVVANFAGYIVVVFFAGGAELMLAESVVRALLPVSWPAQSVALGILLAATVLNLVGVDLFARLQNVLTLMKVVALIGLGLLASHGAPAAASASTAGGLDLSQVMPLVAVVIWGLLGAEYICPMIEEARDPARTVPKAMWVTLLVAVGLYGLFAFGARHRLPGDVLAGAELPHLLVADRVAGRWGLWLVAVAALTASVGLVSSVMAAVPRLLYGMACDGQAFSVFQRLHPRFQTPWVAILFIAGAIAASLVLLSREPKAFTVLILSAVTSWLLAYIVAHVDVLALRLRYPQLARPYRSRWCPLPQLFGIGAMVYCLCHVSPDPALTRLIYGYAGAVLSLIAVVAFVWVKFVQRRPLFKPVPF